MKKVTGWWFCKDNKLPYGDNRIIKLGKTHTVKGKVIPCRNGLHLSPKIIDALEYAPGNIVYRVQGHGTIVPHSNDKFACSMRTYIDGGIDIEKTLRKFACLCALDVIDLWDAPKIVKEYLKTQNPKIRDAALGAARGAAWDAARNAARDATRDVPVAARDAALAAARAAARDAAWGAARDAARAAAWGAVRAAARDAALAAVRAAARDAAFVAAWGAANKRLHKMVVYQINKLKGKQ